MLFSSLARRGKQGLNVILVVYERSSALVALILAAPLSLLVKLTGLLWRRK